MSQLATQNEQRENPLGTKPTRWYRLTTSTGPAAIEACEVLDDKVAKRWQVEEKNVRAVVLARLGDMLDGVEDS